MNPSVNDCVVLAVRIRAVKHAPARFGATRRSIRRGARRIAIIGAGRIGGNVARQLARAGREVQVAFARDAAKLARLADETGATVASPAAAVAFAEVVVVSVP